MADLVLQGGRIIDPANRRDEVADIAFVGGKVAAVGRDLPSTGTKTVNVAGKLVTPGLIDLHAHVYWGGTSLGVDAAEIARKSATATFVDAGSSGPGNFHGFRRHVIEPAPVRILPILNISHAGIFAFATTVMVGECADLRLLDPRDCVRVIAANRDLIVGVKVRVGRTAGGNSGIAPLDMALEVAEEVGLPLMAHLDHPPPSRLEVLSRLRKGDILTHCFRPFPNAPAGPDGRVREEVAAARERGVVFDIGHGGGSFGFRTAEAMLAAGFLPDVISSDVHRSASTARPSIRSPRCRSCCRWGWASTMSSGQAPVRPPPRWAARISAISASARWPMRASSSLPRARSTTATCWAKRGKAASGFGASGLVISGKWWHPV